MHELPMSEAILHTVEARAGRRRVARVRVHVGTELAAHEEPLRFGFELASEGGVCEGAQLDVVPAAGETLVVESIEYAEDASCA